MKTIQLLIAITFIINAKAQTVSDFENITLTTGSYQNGKDSTVRANHGFNSGNAFFPNIWDTSFGGLWTGGFAISNLKNANTDSSTADYSRIWTSITGGGTDSSSNYAIVQDHSVIHLTGNAAGKQVMGTYITNSNYSWLAMKWGDGFAHKFGDSDFFKVIFKGYGNGSLKAEVMANLATGKNLLNTWQWVELRALDDVDSIMVSLISSDSGSLGINTPAFFCMDNFMTMDQKTGLVVVTQNSSISVYPNPLNDFVRIDCGKSVLISATLNDAEGRVLYSGNEALIQTSHFESGVYFLSIHTSEGDQVKKLIKVSVNLMK